MVTQYDAASGTEWPVRDLTREIEPECHCPVCQLVAREAIDPSTPRLRRCPVDLDIIALTERDPADLYDEGGRWCEALIGGTKYPPCTHASPSLPGVIAVHRKVLAERLYPAA